MPQPAKQDQVRIDKRILEKIFGSKDDINQQKERSLLLGLLFGAVSLGITVIAMMLANSMTLQSNFLRSTSETLAVFFAWLTVRKVAASGNQTYDYGYGKFENLASLIVAAVMIISLVVIIRGALTRFMNPMSVAGVGASIGLWFACAAGGANGWYWVRTRRLARRQSSPILESQWRLFRAKTIANICVVVSLAATGTLSAYRWTIYIDPAGSLVLAAFLFISAYSVISMSVYDLLDRTLEESLQLIILRELASFFHDYKAFHGIRSRRSGARIYIQVFLEFDKDQRMNEVQATICQIKQKLEDAIQDSEVSIIPTTESPEKS